MSISVSQHIKARLSASPELAAKAGERMYPIVAPQGTEYPYVVYERTSVSPHYTKDGTQGDTVTASVYVCSDNYGESVAVAEEVRKALDCTTGSYGTFEVADCYLSDAEESYADNAYTQQLTFTIKTEEL